MLKQILAVGKKLFRLRIFTFLLLNGTGEDVDYYCFMIALLGLKGKMHDIVELKFNEEG
jgi:hypothetical protein